MPSQKRRRANLRLARRPLSPAQAKLATVAPLIVWRSVLTFLDRQKILGKRRASARSDRTVLTFVDR